MRHQVWAFLFLCGWARAADHSAPSTSIILTAVENGSESQDSFRCYGKIHGYIRLARRESDTHLLESRWIAPSGKVAADGRTPLDFKPARSTAYVWFAFPESSSLLGAPDPALDEERLTFNGLWRLEVRWDENVLLQKEFHVRCP